MANLSARMEKHFAEQPAAGDSGCALGGGSFLFRVTAPATEDGNNLVWQQAPEQPPESKLDDRIKELMAAQAFKLHYQPLTWKPTTPFSKHRCVWWMKTMRCTCLACLKALGARAQQTPALEQLLQQLKATLSSSQRIVVTGVEDAKALSWFWERGIRNFQGYFIQEPKVAMSYDL